MIEWLLLTTGGAAIYAASKLIRLTRRSATKASQQTTGKVGQPLKLVVAQCEARWFLQDLKVAMSGDVEAMVRVSHMLMAGYGTKQDHAAAAAWMRQAWAIQNYKEPAMLHDMLDVRGSDIPALNDAADRQTTGAVVHSIPATQGSSSSSSSGSSAGRNVASGMRKAAAAAASSSNAGHGGSSKQSGCRGPGVNQQVSVRCSTSGTADDLHSTGTSCGGRQEPQQQQRQQQQRKKSHHASSYVETQSQQQQQQQQQALPPLQQTTRLRKQMVQGARRTVQPQRAAAAVLAGAGHQPVAAAALATAPTACHAVG